MFEVLIFFFAEHVLHLIVEVFFSIFEVYFEGVAVEGVGIRVDDFVGFEHGVFGFFVRFDHPCVFGHFANVDRNGLVVDQLFLDLHQTTSLTVEFQEIIVVGQQGIWTHEVLTIPAQHYHCLR